MEKPVRRLLFFFALLFLGLLVQLTYVQVVAAPRLNQDPANTRGIEAELRIQRGTIVTADDVVLAESVKQGDIFARRYPQGALASPWIGYNSVRYGRGGLERAYNEELAGHAAVLGFRTYLDVLTGKPQRGADLRLTLRADLQRVAQQALGDRTGAVVALDPKTGAILAMVSYPRYDPNQLDERWKELSSDPGRPLVDRPLQGLYPPGSAFKPLVAGAALEEGKVRPDTSFDDNGRYLAGGYVVRNFGEASYGQHDFAEALIESVNTTFAKVGVQLGAGPLAAYTAAFGFGAELPLRLESAKSSFPAPAAMDTAHVAQASFGQGEVLATPMQMALLAAGIANGGVVMKPYLVAEVRDYRQTVLDSTKPSQWLKPLSAATAGTVRDMMAGVVERGTGTAAALSGVTVAGKTGTAEVGSGETHAWFIGFAPAGDPQVAVAVIVEHGGTGGAVAAPVARQVMAAVLGQ